MALLGTLDSRFEPVNRLVTYLSFVRFSHSVFALPFALTGALLGAGSIAVHLAAGRLDVVAMVAARSAAMGFNRLVDARIRRAQPAHGDARDAARRDVDAARRRVFVIVSSVVFVFASWQLNPAVRRAVAGRARHRVLVFAGQALHAYTQAFLGLAMAVAPVGGWLAAGGRGGWEPWLLGLAIGLWVGGFDVLYACQDLEFDRAHGLRSIPVRFGIARSLLISRAMHVGDRRLHGGAGVARAARADLSRRRRARRGAARSTSSRSCQRDDLSQVKRAFDLNG